MIRTSPLPESSKPLPKLYLCDVLLGYKVVCVCLGQWQGGESWVVVALAVRASVRSTGGLEKEASVRVLGLASKLADFPGAQRSRSKQLPADPFCRHLALGWDGG